MRNRNVRGKVIKVKWGEFLVPLIFMGFCISYIVQVVDVILLSIAFAIGILVILIPILIILIRKSIVKEDAKECEGNRVDSLWKFLPAYARNVAKNKQAMITVIFIFCFGVICYIFGFVGFTLALTLLILLLLGVSKPIHLAAIAVGLALFIYFVFIRFLYYPLPRGMF